MKNTQTQGKSLGRDEMLGRALMRSAAANAPVGACPPLEEIAALVEGTLPEESRDRLFGHLADCTSCRETYTLSKELSEPVVRLSRVWYIAPSAVAIAVVMVIAITLTMRQGERPGQQMASKTPHQAGDLARPGMSAPAVPPTPPTIVARKHQPPEMLPLTAPQAARLLIKGQDPRSLVARAGGSRAKTYGFATGQTKTGSAFSIGVYSLTLELALLANDRDAASMNLMRIGQYAPSVSDNKRLSKMLEDRQQRLDEGAPLGNMQGITEEIGNQVPLAEKQYFRFGVWCEAGRLAAVLGKGDFFTQKAVSYFEKNLPAEKLPNEAKEAFLGVAAEIRKPQMDLEELGRSLDRLCRTFM
jgi:hypothetical protein